MSNKKDLAIVLGATGNMAFAVANVVLQLQEKISNVNYEIIILHQNFPEKDMELINSIHPTKFIEYNYPFEVNKRFNEWSKKVFTIMCFSIYECFNFLKDYKKVFWTDYDVIFKTDLTDIIKDFDRRFALAKADFPISQNFSKIPKELSQKYDMTECACGTGFMMIDDNLKDWDKMTDWCYEFTNKYIEYFVYPDQCPLNILPQEFGLNPIHFDYSYITHPRDKKILKKANIIHSHGQQKFWNSLWFPEWNKFHKKWLKMGGSDFAGKKDKLLDRIWLTHFPYAINVYRHPGKFIKQLITKGHVNREE